MAAEHIRKLIYNTFHEMGKARRVISCNWKLFFPVICNIAHRKNISQYFTNSDELIYLTINYQITLHWIESEKLS